MLILAAWALTGGALSGCSSSSSMNPINWWHREEGGKIAKARPAPPGADQAYPNLATVPAKPAPVDQKALDQLTNSLIADRTNAQHAAESAPLADPSSPSASPTLFGVGTAPPPPLAGATASAGSSGSAGPPAGTTGGTPAGTPVASASMPAVTAPPRAHSGASSGASAPLPAPRRPVQSAPLEAPAADTSGAPAAAAAAANPPVAPGSDVAPGTAPSSPPGTTVAGVSPALPAGPPPRPAAAGEPPVAVLAPPPMPPPSGAGPSARIVFLERASSLSPPASDEVKAFAGKRGNGTISVVGYGDSASSDPDAQSAALDLGLSRAQSIVEALKSAGVPGNAIRVSAEASGRGASLRVIQ
ncbi:hypothetical protein [Rhodopila sp.]|uniref:hypothetical protein n=1 Tax=Rhodopila sp. TaxID=2480087 RepID=UPI003D0AE094